MVERSRVTMQDRHQVDDGVMASHQPGQIHFHMDIGLDHVDPWQWRYRARVDHVPGWHGEAAVQLPGLFTEMAADESAAAQYQNSFHRDLPWVVRSCGPVVM